MLNQLKYILPLIFLTSCYTQRKAEQQIRRADVIYPVSTATFCASRFPVVPRTNTVIETNTDTLYQQGDTVVMGDTVVITRTVTNTIRTTIHDTIPDVAAINTLQGINTTLQADVRTWQDRAVKAQDKADALRNGRNTWRWIGIVSLAAILVYVVLRILGALKIVKL